jgi:hypothetical protein
MELANDTNFNFISVINICKQTNTQTNSVAISPEAKYIKVHNTQVGITIHFQIQGNLKGFFTILKI